MTFCLVTSCIQFSHLYFQIQPELISLNPMDIVHVTTMPKKDDDDDEVSK